MNAEGRPHLFFGEELTEAEFDLFFGGLAAQDGFVTVFVTPKLMTDIDVLAGDRMQTVPPSQTYGLPVKQIQLAQGNVNIVKMSGEGRVGLAFLRPYGIVRGLG